VRCGSSKGEAARDARVDERNEAVRGLARKMRASHFGWLASLADLSLAAAAAYKRSASEPTRRLFNCNSVTQEVYQQLNRSSENHSFTGNFLILSVIIFLCLYGKIYNSVIHNI